MSSHRRSNEAPRLLPIAVHSGAHPAGRSGQVVIDRTIRDMELALAQEDPYFVRRVRRLQGSDVVHAVAVTVLLALGALLLVVGMATQSWGRWSAGGLAFIASFAVDALHQRRLRR